MMKLFLMFLLFFNCNMVMANKELEYIIEDSYKETSKLKFDNIIINSLDRKINVSFVKENISGEYSDTLGRISTTTQDIIYNISVDGYNLKKIHNRIPSNGQKILTSYCTNQEESVILITVLSYGDYDKITPWFIQFIPNVFEIKKDASIVDRIDLVHYFNNGSDPYFDNRIIDEQNSRKVYPYYNESKILDRAYKTNICSKVAINARLGHGLINNKSYLYNDNFIMTNMYLVKGDKVNLLNQWIDSKGQKWYFINYKGKKDINMWIKAEAVDLK
ncbi:hypothetical protein NYR80_04450 [Actinobacillus equuli subsp. haemolyticus]|uniref:hypothetical protein n=2 Tax=Actinobacillus equuli TaxID=718 RepID=UPI00244670B3|nr:hypothetical protein [Actinobacillus equuli]WGE74254.1 hypothetical protein NYR80_04450 [Actinobacillus equuli subsp. haemolyticus]